MVSSNNGSPPASNNGGADNRPVEVVLASWADRFVAWLVDFIIVSIGLGILFALLALPFWLSDYSNGTAIVHRNFGFVSPSSVKQCFLCILDLF